MKKRATFRQIDVRGVLATGVGVARVEIGADGKLVMFTGNPLNRRQAEGGELDRNLAKFKTRHGYD